MVILGEGGGVQLLGGVGGWRRPGEEQRSPGSVVIHHSLLQVGSTTPRNHFTWLRASAEEKERQQESLGGHQPVPACRGSIPRAPRAPCSLCLSLPLSGLSEKLEVNWYHSSFPWLYLNTYKSLGNWEDTLYTPACCLLCVVVNKAKAADGTCRHRGMLQGSSWPWVSRYHRWAARLFWFLFAKGEIGVFKCKYAIKWNLVYF